MKQLPVGFVVPSGRFNHDPFRVHPLTILYLMTIMEESFGDQLDLSLIDTRGIEEKSLLYHIPEKSLFLYSPCTLDYNETVSLVKSLRMIYPMALHVAGGVHVTLFPDECAEVFDAVAIGDGESSIQQIIRDIFSGNLKKFYRHARSTDFNTHSFPSRKWLPKQAVATTGILNKEFSGLKATSILLSRGCPFTCHFCANLESGKILSRSPEQIEQEIDYLKREYQVEGLALKDDNAIPLGKSMARPFLEAIGRTNVKWRGQSRAMGVLPEIAQLAKDAGCVEVAIGMESVSEKALSIVNKKIKLPKVREYLSHLKKIGIGIRLHLIMGLPGESKDIAIKTREFVDEMELNSVFLSLLTPVPGSELFNNPERFGMRITSRNWDDYRNLFSGFDVNERPKMIFEYQQNTPWGKPLSNDEIIDNFLYLTSYFSERNLKF